jgi:MFS family permease
MLLVCVTLVGIGNNIWHPAAIPTLAYRYPQRKGLVLSFHGMGGNVGEAFAPIVVGAMLGWLSWRQVVVINVVPGIMMAALILVMLGAFATRSGDDDGINAGGEKRSFRDYLKDSRTSSITRRFSSGFASRSCRSAAFSQVPLRAIFRTGWGGAPSSCRACC